MVVFPGSGAVSFGLDPSRLSGRRDGREEGDGCETREEGEGELGPAGGAEASAIIEQRTEEGKAD